MVHYVTFILERIALFFFPNLSLKYWHGYTQLFGTTDNVGQWTMWDNEVKSDPKIWPKVRGCVM